MLKLENVSKRIGGFELKNISAKLPDGYIMGMIGENGAGKTTLIHIISGLYSIDSGDMEFDGMRYPKQEELIKQDIGMVIHGDVFDMHETLLQNGRRYGRFYNHYDEKALLEYMLRFKLDRKKKYGHLSKGEKLKFSMAFALAHKPKYLLLDEPTANFDVDFRKEFLKLLREYTGNGKNSVVLSTHITSDIDIIADYLLFLKDGKQMLYGDIETIRNHYRMVAGEAYKIKLLKDRVLHMENGKFGCKALVRNSKKPFDSMLKIWEPTIEELMYYMAKEGDVK